MGLPLAIGILQHVGFDLPQLDRRHRHAIAPQAIAHPFEVGVQPGFRGGVGRHAAPAAIARDAADAHDVSRAFLLKPLRHGIDPRCRADEIDLQR